MGITVTRTLDRNRKENKKVYKTVKVGMDVEVYD